MSIAGQSKLRCRVSKLKHASSWIKGNGKGNDGSPVAEPQKNTPGIDARSAIRPCDHRRRRESQCLPPTTSFAIKSTEEPQQVLPNSCWWSEGSGSRIKYKVTDSDTGDVINIKTGRRLSFRSPVKPQIADDEDSSDSKPISTAAARTSDYSCPLTRSPAPAPTFFNQEPPASDEADAGSSAMADPMASPTINEQFPLGASEARQLRERVRQLEKFITDSGLTPPL